MSHVQHEGARHLLDVIKAAQADNRLLTYESAAIALGRSKGHARAVAQMCDLLDAAAAYSGTPLLALIAIREKSGHVNRAAWKGSNVPEGVRDQVLAISLRWKFSKRDYASIAEGLKNLVGVGNRAAWQKVKAQAPGKNLFKLVASLGRSPGLSDDAINDLGTDEPVRSDRQSVSYARDKRVRSAVLARAQGVCEFCSTPGFLKTDGTRYLETHHIIALANDGTDRTSNVIALCPEHHRQAHFGVARERLEKEMVDRLRGFRS